MGLKIARSRREERGPQAGEAITLERWKRQKVTAKEKAEKAMSPLSES